MKKTVSLYQKTDRYGAWVYDFTTPNGLGGAPQDDQGVYWPQPDQGNGPPKAQIVFSLVVDKTNEQQFDFGVLYAIDTSVVPPPVPE